MKWHDALNSTWLDLGTEELGGVRVTDHSIRFKHHLPPDGQVRITFSNISKNRFTWTADFSNDEGETWVESVMAMEALRKRR